jgi:predicted TIM-barrel fold metal-dependent hydrolase
MHIDVHSHLYPAEYLDLLVATGRADLKRVHSQSLDMSERVEAQDQAGVGAQVLSFIGLNTVVEDPTGATDTAQCLNDVYADVCAKNPGRFLAFAMLPLPHVERAIAEAERALRSPTCVGVGLPCSISGTPLDDERFDELWAALDERQATVFVHPVGSDSCGHWGLDDWGMSAMFGSPIQLGVAACRLVFSGLTTRYPHLRFVFAQGGGFLPARWEAIENTVLRPGFAGHAPYMLGWVKDLDVDPDDPMARFRDFWYDTASFHQAPTTLLAAKRSYGVDRLVLGSDALFGSLTEMVSFLGATSDLDAGPRRAVLERADAGLRLRP